MQTNAPVFAALSQTAREGKEVTMTTVLASFCPPTELYEAELYELYDGIFFLAIVATFGMTTTTTTTTTTTMTMMMMMMMMMLSLIHI